MNRSDLPKTGIKLPPLGLGLQLFAFILLPLTLLLVAITFGSYSIHQNEMRSLVGERDARLVHTAASALDAQINSRSNNLRSLMELFTLSSSQPVTTTLASLDPLLPGFDAGIAILSQQGDLLAWVGDAQFWNGWSSIPSAWADIFSQVTTSPGKLLVTRQPGNPAMFGLISARATEGSLLVGAFSVTQLAQTTLGDILPSDGQLSVLLVSADHTILYNVGHLSDQSADHPGVTQALQGQSGTVYVKVGGDEHVTAYSPVTAAGWALLTEESWQAVSTPVLRLSQTAPLVLVPAVLIMLLALWFGATQIVKPLQALESQSSRLAQGDFVTIQAPVGGIAEIQHLQKELIQMAGKVEDAQRSLHGYIGAITAAQEDERRRLARELHDDTLQALIALKQRVQLAQLELQVPGKQPAPDPTELDAIALLTEQTIENLRRLTRALRPAYLEDLGLVPSLEMLARETGQSAGIPVEFTHQGIEKRLPASNELTLYRMAQEACNNIIRHARASKAALSITYLPEAVVLRVEDDGMGFDIPRNSAIFAASGHYGLLGLHERAELMGAELVIRSSPGSGTSITVTLPVKMDQNGE